MNMAEYLQLKEEERRETALKAEKKVHKCNGCMWGAWAGNKFSCAFATCFKDKL